MLSGTGMLLYWSEEWYHFICLPHVAVEKKFINKIAIHCKTALPHRGNMSVALRSRFSSLLR